MSARHMQTLIKNDEPVLLAIIRTSNDFVTCGKNKKEGNQRSPGYAAVNWAHGMTEGQKRKINKDSGPKNNIISMKEREREVLESVPAIHRKSLDKTIQEYRDVFPDELPNGAPPNREVKHHIEIEPGSDPPYRPPYRLGPAEQDDLRNR